MAVTGHFASVIENVAPKLTSAGGQDVFLVGYSASGPPATSASSLGGPGDDLGLGVALDSNGDPVVVGSFEKTAMGVTSYGKSDLFVRSLKSSPPSWTITCGTTEADGAAAVGLDGTGAAFVVGQLGAAGPSCGPSLPHAGLSDLLIGQWSAAGAKVAGWPVAYGGIGDDLGHGIAVGSGALYVVGTTNSSTLFGRAGAPAGDVFVAKIKR